MDLTFRDVDTTTWDDLDTLFSSRGGPKYCWCMVWRPKPSGASKVSNDVRRGWLKAFVDRSVPIGILGYADDEPVGWCSIGPRPEHRRLGGPDDFADRPNAVWSLTCFYVKRALRGEGLSRQLLDAAIERARRGGAEVVEAYPVLPSSPSYRFMGVTTLFKRAGFEELGPAGTRRHVMRLALD